jgi:choline dehydrogenase-like flavoprotein
MNSDDLNNAYDVIVIGSGAGGSAAAYKLATQGLRVLVLEKGGELPQDGSTLDFRRVVREGAFKSKEAWRDGYNNEITPEEYFNVGGKTKWYGAALLRYSASEFESDYANQYFGWPLSLKDIEPYYAEAERLLGVRTFECEPDLAKISGALERQSGWRSEALPLGLKVDILRDPHEARHFDGFASVAQLKGDGETAFLQHVRARPNATVVTNAEVCELLCDSDPLQVNGVKLSDGRAFHGRAVILAAGALHSPRILQRHIARHELSKSLPNADVVGRNLKLHLLTAVVAISAAAKSDLLRKTRLLTHDDFPRSSVQPLGFDSELIATLIPKIVPMFIAKQIGRRAYGFFLQTEDGSHPDNRVRTLKAPDDSIHSVLDYDSRRTLSALKEHHHLVARLKSSLARAGLIAFSQRIGIEGTAHACGTLIAGSDPLRNVVDAQGRVHGMRGLYVADGSVLPRSSRVNPSLTIYAWSLRIAEQLGSTLTNAQTTTEELLPV